MLLQVEGVDLHAMENLKGERLAWAAEGGGGAAVFGRIQEIGDFADGGNRIQQTVCGEHAQQLVGVGLGSGMGWPAVWYRHCSWKPLQMSHRTHSVMVGTSEGNQDQVSQLVEGFIDGHTSSGTIHDDDQVVTLVQLLQHARELAVVPAICDEVAAVDLGDLVQW